MRYLYAIILLCLLGLPCKAQEGIRFETIPFQQALDKARAEGKLVFIDCFTQTCAPCKRMARDIFPLKECGDYFNPRFISLAHDMEAGEGVEIAKKYEFLYVGGHPMAGTQYSGFKYSRANLYHRAPMVIVPPRYDDMALLQKIKDILSPAGFGKITVAKADEHDEMIAYTSQLAHIVSNAYIKSPTARAHKGMSAGSYKDMTRVAWLNPQMWTELCMENREYLMKEMDILIDSLNEYQKALKENDSETLMRLFDEGRKIKKEVDG